MPRPRPPRPCPRTAAPGYALPLAVGASGVLLLLSLTLHGMAMQERLQVGARERQQREEDLLVSAAHQLLAALNASHRCLLALPLAQWEQQGAACATPAAVAALKNGQVMARPVRVLAWQPGGNGQTAKLALQLETGNSQLMRKGRYGVRLTGSPPQGAQLGPPLLGQVN
jgi:hypothetical protein